MRDYSITELATPRTYRDDPGLAAFARRVAAARWSASLGRPLAEWKAEHLVGRHAQMIACALVAYRVYVDRHGDEVAGAGPRAVA